MSYNLSYILFSIDIAYDDEDSNCIAWLDGSDPNFIQCVGTATRLTPVNREDTSDWISRLLENREKYFL